MFRELAISPSENKALVNDGLTAEMPAIQIHRDRYCTVLNSKLIMK